MKPGVVAPRRIESAGLVFVPPVPDDADDIYARYAGDAEVTRYLSWPRHQSVEATHGFIAFSDAQWEHDGVGPYLIRQHDGRLLGSTGLDCDGHGGAITGYVLAKDAWGRGVATEALAAMVDLARFLGLARVVAYCHPDHAASIRVLEKGGFARVDSGRRPVVFPNLAPGVEIEALCFSRALP